MENAKIIVSISGWADVSGATFWTWDLKHGHRWDFELAVSNRRSSVWPDWTKFSFLGRRPLAPLLLGPPFFSRSSFWSTTLLTGMTGISLHRQWPPTSQLHGSVSQRKQMDFCYRSNSTPISFIFNSCRKNCVWYAMYCLWSGWSQFCLGSEWWYHT
jgi:hypothetical protein